MLKIDKISILFFMIGVFMFIGTFNTYFTIVSLIGTIVLSCIIALESIKRGNYKICINLILLLCFQNFLIGTGAHLARNIGNEIKFITQIPFLVILIIWLSLQVWQFQHNSYKNKEKKVFYLLVICIISSILIDRGSIQAILINVRNMTTFFMAYEIGLFFLNTEDKFDNFVIRYNRILLFMLIIGIVLLIGGYPLYSKIGIDEVYVAKQDFKATGALNARFYTNLFSRRILRMGSLYYEPVNLSYLYAAGFIINIFYKSTIKKYRIINILLSGIGLILTFGKGGWLIVLGVLTFSIIYKFIKLIFKKVPTKDIYFISLILMIVCLVLFCIYAYKNINTSANPHFWGVIRTWENVKNNPIGYGLGTGGNMAYVFNEDYVASYEEDNSWLSSGGESAIMSYIYQIGVHGTIILVICLLMTGKYEKTEENLFMYVMKTIPLIIIGVAILQENTFTPQCIVPFMLLQGGSKNLFLIKKVDS